MTQNICLLCPSWRDSVWPLTTNMFYLIMWEFSTVFLSLQSSRLQLSRNRKPVALKPELYHSAAVKCNISICIQRRLFFLSFKQDVCLMRLFFYRFHKEYVLLFETLNMVSNSTGDPPPNCSRVHASSGSLNLGHKGTEAKGCRGVFWRLR